jgi:hypothetical protein
MAYIEESIETKTAAKRIWQAFVETYKRKGQTGFKEGSKGYVSSQGKSLPFEIIDIKKGESFTTLWKSLLVKFYFIYSVEELDKGSRITCHVKVKGPLGFLVAPFLKKKMRKNVRQFLEEFAFQLEQSQYGMFR